MDFSLGGKKKWDAFFPVRSYGKFKEGNTVPLTMERNHELFQ
jgi:hypothetical protein